jgi:hypothetical protein
MTTPELGFADFADYYGKRQAKVRGGMFDKLWSHMQKSGVSIRSVA